MPLPPLASLLAADGSPHAGRFGTPLPAPVVAAPPWRLKEWHYTSLCTPDFFLAFAMVQLGYVANAFCYLVDRRDGRSWQTEALAPFGLGVRFAPGSVQGATRWHRRRERIEVAWTGTGWLADLDLRLGGESLRAHFTFAPGEALVLVHPLAPGRLAYTHKDAGMSAHGTLAFRGEQVDVAGLATLDWTRSYALRTTRWKWASLVHVLPDGRRLGLNLSAEVYDGPDGSQEDAAWLDGSVHLLPGVQFELPAEPQSQPWRIHGAGIELAFEPLGARSQDVRLGIIRSRFVQPFGLFRGTVVVAGERLALDGAFGVVEDHLSVW